MRENKSKYKKVIICSFAIILVVLCICLCIKLVPFIASLQNEVTRIEFENYINDLGIKGFLLFLLIQIAQIFIAFIPGEIVELLAGILYGPWLGLLVCLLGNFIGSFLIYSIVKLFASKYMIKLQEKLSHYSFLNNRKKIGLYLFIIYLIPGIPKDIITYLVPFLPINFLTFIIVTSIARVPSIISSTYSSDSILNNNYTIAIILLAIFALLAIIGFIFKDKIIKILKKDNENNDSSSK